MNHTVRFNRWKALVALLKNEEQATERLASMTALRLGLRASTVREMLAEVRRLKARRMRLLSSLERRLEIRDIAKVLSVPPVLVRTTIKEIEDLMRGGGDEPDACPAE
ncbi:MAG: hypothetical protein LBM77_09255 [Spirochaetaceae bacterium]|jgi:hypothetical protein|nr:hypothetical protein [Spirochaetaceae bacterium]